MIALSIGAVHSLAVTILPGLRLAYDKPQLHLILETAEGLIAALLAYLAAGRFRSTGRLDHLAMAWAFSVLALVNLFLSAGPIAILGSRPGGDGDVGGGGAPPGGHRALYLASLSTTRSVVAGRPLAKALFLTTGAAAVTIMLAVVVADAWWRRSTRRHPRTVSRQGRARTW